MTPKGKTQVTNKHLDEIVPIVRATHGNESAIEIAKSLLNLLLGINEELEKAKKAQVKKRGKEDKET